MHRILNTLFVLIFLSAVFLCGCGKDSSADRLITSFSADFNADYRGLKLKGSLVSTHGGNLEIQITSPNTLDGLEIGYKGNDMQLRREELICSADEAYLPRNSFPSLIREITGGLTDGRTAFSTEDDDEIFFNLKIPNDICIICSTKSGEIKSIKTKSDDFYIELTDFREVE